MLLLFRSEDVVLGKLEGDQNSIVYEEKKEALRKVARGSICLSQLIYIAFLLFKYF